MNKPKIIAEIAVALVTIAVLGMIVLALIPNGDMNNIVIVDEGITATISDDDPDTIVIDGLIRITNPMPKDLTNIEMNMAAGSGDETIPLLHFIEDKLPSGESTTMDLHCELSVTSILLLISYENNSAAGSEPTPIVLPLQFDFQIYYLDSRAGFQADFDMDLKVTSEGQITSNTEQNDMLEMNFIGFKFDYDFPTFTEYNLDIGDKISVNLTNSGSGTYALTIKTDDASDLIDVLNDSLDSDGRLSYTIPAGSGNTHYFDSDESATIISLIQGIYNGGDA